MAGLPLKGLGQMSIGTKTQILFIFNVSWQFFFLKKQTLQCN